MYKRQISSNRDIRDKIKKMLVNSKAPRSSRVCIPVDIIYNTIYLDKWDRLVAIGEKCKHGNLVPSFWDVYRKGPGDYSENLLRFRFKGKKREQDHWINVRKSFSQTFQFELVNSCLLDINKKSTFLDILYTNKIIHTRSSTSGKNIHTLFMYNHVYLHKIT